MKAFERTTVQDIVLLSFVAGAADGAGFLGLGQVFTSNMTGNVVLFGIALGQGNFFGALQLIEVIALFVCGVIAGAWFARGVDAQDWPTLSSRLVRPEAALLLFFAVGWALPLPVGATAVHIFFIAALAIAMGLQSTAMNRLSLPGVATTAVTGTLTSLTMGFCHFLVAPRAQESVPAGASERILFQSLALGLYCGGAGVSAVLMRYLPQSVGVVPAMVALFVALRPR
jgi:uncharacterized membrane protein YoaK (UPF0700 family)